MTAKERGLEIIILGAGGAAHLAGAAAAYTELPVIGVPVKSRAMNGVDSMWSTVQMPKGVPVATMAIDGAENAALLAARFIGVHDDNVGYKVREHSLKLQFESSETDIKLQQKGARSYLNDIEDGSDE